MGIVELGKDKSLFNKIPKSALMFLLKAGFFYLVWICLYHFYLEPKELIDPPLTKAVASATHSVLSFLYPHDQISLKQYGSVIILKNKFGSEMTILAGCNALELYIFYIGFIICYSGPLKLSLKYAFYGILGITILNIARCTALFYLTLIHFRYIDSVHHYVFTIVVYSFILMLWFYFFKISLKSANKSQVNSGS